MTANLSHLINYLVLVYRRSSYFTVTFRMCSFSLSYSVTQCVLNVLTFYNFFHCSACVFDMCLLNYLLTYLYSYFVQFSKQHGT